MSESETPLEGGDLLRFVYTCPLALLLTGPDGEIQLLNGAATSLLMPFSPDGDLENLFDLIESHDAGIREILSREKQALKLHKQLVRRVAMTPEFVDRTFHLSFTFGLFDEGYSITVQDVSDDVAREAENKELLAREAHERGRVEVASGILHDLGNALTGIATRAVDIRGRIDDKSSANNLQRLCVFLRPRATELDSVLGAGKGAALLTMLDALMQAMEKNQQDAQDSMQKMLAFIAHAQELLTINRTFAGSGSDPAGGTSNLRKVLDDLLMMTSAGVQQRSGRFETEYDDSLPPVAIDRSRLMQVLINLIKNATEAFDTVDRSGSEADGLLVQLSMDRDTEGRLQIVVQDNGPGFDKQLGESDKLFDHGFSTRERGSGVGLSGCKRIIAAYGGSIRVESEGLGCGARATILLPKEVFKDAD